MSLSAAGWRNIAEAANDSAELIILSATLKMRSGGNFDFRNAADHVFILLILTSSNRGATLTFDAVTFYTA